MIILKISINFVKTNSEDRHFQNNSYQVVIVRPYIFSVNINKSDLFCIYRNIGISGNHLHTVANFGVIVLPL